MSNPFEFFNASDDDEPQTNIVKKDDKHKLSNSSINQLTQRREPTRNSKKKVPKKLLRLLKVLKELLLKKLFLKELRIILIIEDVICLAPSSKSSIKKSGVKRTPLVTISIEDQELAESKNSFI